MVNDSRTMRTLSYGIFKPEDLLKKLESDADKLIEIPHPYEIFNFIVTAAILAEWMEKYYQTNRYADAFSAPTKQKKEWTIPSGSEEWIVDTSCIPNVYNGIQRHIKNCLSICLHTANASKHFHWKDSGNVTAIGQNPPISDAYQYFFTSTAKDVYLDMNGENYGLQQIKGTLLQFYAGLLKYSASQEILNASGTRCD